MNNNETSKSFQAHITYDDAIRAIDLENTIYAIRLFAQNQMRADANERIQAYTDCVKISGVEKGSIILNFDLDTAINIAQLAMSIYGVILTHRSKQRSPSNDKEPWINIAIRDLITAINNGVRIYLRDEHGNEVDINNGEQSKLDYKTPQHLQVGDKVCLNSGGPIMTITVIEAENATCIYFGQDNQVKELIVPIAGLVK